MAECDRKHQPDGRTRSGRGHVYCPFHKMAFFHAAGEAATAAGRDLPQKKREIMDQVLDGRAEETLSSVASCIAVINWQRAVAVRRANLHLFKGCVIYAIDLSNR